ncbi:MAG: hypothetical protein A3J25_19730 [Pseudomonadales bacterium RIFCSPLOWO2_02_FULL_63_210]|nr:MAG: hypothetical protein A3J25_19730 [Pseudomonadales bacterium RIFCSPLOWO2_02_FULL_63_210]
MQRVERKRLWGRRIEEWQSSGLTQRAYCTQESISYATFKGWRRRVRRAANKSVRPARLVPVRVVGGRGSETAFSRHPDRADSGLSAHGVEIRLASGRAIVLDARFDEVELGRLVRLLEVLPC